MLVYISKMKIRINCYDITRAAGVSQTVVSLVINGKADKYRIAKATQERVRAAISQYGYTPDMTLRNMFLKRRQAIEIGGAAADPAGLKAAIEPALNAAGYQFQAVMLSTEPDTALAQVTALLNSGKVILVQSSLDPSPDPIPDSEPAPVVEPVTPTPTPAPVPSPQPAPIVDPTPEPTPSPEPAPVVDPIDPDPIQPTPEPAPVVEPDVEVNPTPEPMPEPVPAPEPSPEPAPEPAPAPEPDPDPEPAPIVEPVDPDPVEPTPDPAPVVEPVEPEPVEPQPETQ